MNALLVVDAEIAAGQADVVDVHMHPRLQRGQDFQVFILDISSLSEHMGAVDEEHVARFERLKLSKRHVLHPLLEQGQLPLGRKPPHKLRRIRLDGQQAGGSLAVCSTRIGCVSLQGFSRHHRRLPRAHLDQAAGLEVAEHAVVDVRVDSHVDAIDHREACLSLHGLHREAIPKLGQERRQRGGEKRNRLRLPHVDAPQPALFIPKAWRAQVLPLGHRRIVVSPHQVEASLVGQGLEGCVVDRW